MINIYLQWALTLLGEAKLFTDFYHISKQSAIFDDKRISLKVSGSYQFAYVELHLVSKTASEPRPTI